MCGHLSQQPKETATEGTWSTTVALRMAAVSARTAPSPPPPGHPSSHLPPRSLLPGLPWVLPGQVRAGRAGARSPWTYRSPVPTPPPPHPQLVTESTSNRIHSLQAPGLMLHTPTSFSPQKPQEVGTTIASILQMRKLTQQICFFPNPPSWAQSNQT